MSCGSGGNFQNGSIAIDYIYEFRFIKENRCNLDVICTSLQRNFFYSSGQENGVPLWMVKKEGNDKSDSRKTLIMKPYSRKLTRISEKLNIYGVRVILQKWYLRLHNIQVESLKDLQKQQQGKIEELKKKTSYYMTKGLIERYETPKKEKKPTQPNKPVQRPSQGAISIQSGPHTPGHPHPQQNQVTPVRPIASSNFTPSQTPINRINGPMPSTPNMNQPSIVPLTPQISHVESKSWFDKALDVLVGDTEGPQHKYALICESCFMHNGLVLPEEYLEAKFRCMSCKHLTVKKPSAKALSFGVRRVQTAENDRRYSESVASANSVDSMVEGMDRQESMVFNEPYRTVVDPRTIGTFERTAQPADAIDASMNKDIDVPDTEEPDNEPLNENKVEPDTPNDLDNTENQDTNLDESEISETTNILDKSFVTEADDTESNTRKLRKRKSKK
ncbi:hypothetical protein HDV06_000195 [Boothiomyces sp. JEL0866]|nr:hypothetical protein HDV06_000195 [Boothiomyces sp. JEL0866]